MTIASKQRDEAETRECATLRVNGTRVQGGPCKVLIKVLIWWGVSTLEKPRESFQGAQDAQGAHLDLSTLNNPRRRSARLKSARCVVPSIPTRSRRLVVPVGRVALFYPLLFL
jgi:hypothetical protein